MQRFTCFEDASYTCSVKDILLVAVPTLFDLIATVLVETPTRSLQLIYFFISMACLPLRLSQGLLNAKQ